MKKITDRERLDHLEKSHSYYDGTHEWFVHMSGAYEPTVRQAIDFAIRAERRKRGGEDA